MIAIKCFLGSSAGFRALSNVFKILNKWVSSIAAPAASSIRQWLLKLGLYKLLQPKHSENGWFFIVDTSIQMGPQKCVVVLGVKKDDLHSHFCPTLSQVEALVVKPVCNTPGDVIYEILEEAATKVTGGPIHAIISDDGGENKKGGKLFCEHHLDTIHLPDISHKINTLLKTELENDPIWASFKTKATSSMQLLKLSSIAYLAPPRQRTKARMHSAFDLIEWGARLLRFINSREAENLAPEDINKIEWIKSYENAFTIYDELREQCKFTLELIHQRGYFNGMMDEFAKYFTQRCISTERVSNFYKKILEQLKTIESKISKPIHYLGSSEVIESLFGKFKALEGDHASSGFTSLILAIPGLLGEMDKSIINAAMSEISTLDIKEWTNTNLGQTFLSKRKKALYASESQIGKDVIRDLDLSDFAA